MSVGPGSEVDQDGDAVLTRLRQYLQDFDAELVRTLIDTFVEDTEKGLVMLRAAVEVSSLEDVARVSHRLKGSYLSMGANGSAELCAALEMRARSAAMDDTAGLMNSLEERFALLVPRLEMERSAR
jgi:HPt (histidine-containing phosphotransfer) domain-containing protein